MPTFGLLLTMHSRPSLLARSALIASASSSGLTGFTDMRPQFRVQFWLHSELKSPVETAISADMEWGSFLLREMAIRNLLSGVANETRVHSWVCPGYSS